MISGRRAGGRASKIDKLLRKQTRSSHLEIEAKSDTQRYLRSDRLSDDAQTLRATDDCVMGYVLTMMIPFDPDYLIPIMEDPWQPDGQSLAGVSVAASHSVHHCLMAQRPRKRFLKSGRRSACRLRYARVFSIAARQHKAGESTSAKHIGFGLTRPIDYTCFICRQRLYQTVRQPDFTPVGFQNQ